ncbi:hypothetical protein EVAR_23455_1 [Eumeta japonica]|uniref:Uncharacterized protein n=1 Tax=Eumeta variegata TaxID=151549 RepID=A0A4C1UJT4_EUMVA|nr:hypothetical protein EVAR_23455_1 [Eumeta japonica]
MCEYDDGNGGRGSSYKILWKPNSSPVISIESSTVRFEDDALDHRAAANALERIRESIRGKWGEANSDAY